MGGLRDLIIASGHIIDQLVLLAAGIALLVFLWGLVAFIFKADDESSHEEGKNKMIWGIATLFVMVSVWGIVNLIQRELDIQAPPSNVVDPVNNPFFPPREGNGDRNS